VVGLYVLTKGGGGGLGGAAGDEEAQLVSGGYVANPAFADTTGADLASILGGYSGDIQGQLTEYSASLADAIEALSQIEPGDTGTGEGPGPSTPGSSAYYVWHSSTPQSIRDRYTPYQVVQALRKLGVGPNTRYVSTQNIARGLEKLGYKGVTTSRVGSAWTDWLVRLRRPR
jgi:hypothetical protein